MSLSSTASSALSFASSFLSSAFFFFSSFFFSALLHYLDGEKRYILAPNGLKVGAKVMSGTLNIAKPVTNARRLIVDCMGSPFLRYVNAARKIALYRIGDAAAILVIDGVRGRCFESRG